MKYMGSKNRIAKYIVPILEKAYYENGCEIFIDACCGGCNLIDKVDPNIPRYANDYNMYVVEMWKKLQLGWVPSKISKEEYSDIRGAKEQYDPALVGWVGVACSYSGKWFGGFAGEVKTKQGVRDYQEESFKNLEKQIPNLRGVVFSNKSVLDMNPKRKSLIYCDIPYRNTTGYKDEFPHDDFYKWCREMKSKGHVIYISEYDMPDDFKCVWEKEVSSSLSANGEIGGNKKSTEKLFTL